LFPEQSNLQNTGSTHKHTHTHTHTHTHPKGHLQLWRFQVLTAVCWRFKPSGMLSCVDW